MRTGGCFSASSPGLMVVATSHPHADYPLVLCIDSEALLLVQTFFQMMEGAEYLYVPLHECH